VVVVVATKGKRASLRLIQIRSCNVNWESVLHTTMLTNSIFYPPAEQPSFSMRDDDRARRQAKINFDTMQFAMK
jgi:hypothetical protein